MKTKQIWANLPADDLEKTRNFYTALGFKASVPTDSMAQELVSISFGENNFIINFFRRDILAKNTRTTIAEVNNGSEVIFSLSAESKEEVTAWQGKVKKAGGEINVEPYAIGEGYTFVFSDPDGHKFNFLYWPGM